MKQIREIKVLLAEDDEQVLLITKKILASICSSVDTAKDGREALELFEKRGADYDLVVTDIYMPNLNGIELCRNVKRLKKSIPVIAISGYDDKEYLLDAINSGVDRYLIKPCSKEKVLDLVHELLELKGEFKQVEFLFAGERGFFDYDAETLTIGSARYMLNKRERGFLLCALSGFREVVSLETFLYTVWNPEKSGRDAVYSFVKRFKKKLPEGFIKSTKRGYYLDITKL